MSLWNTYFSGVLIKYYIMSPTPSPATHPTHAYSQKFSLVLNIDRPIIITLRYSQIPSTSQGMYSHTHMFPLGAQTNQLSKASVYTMHMTMYTAGHYSFSSIFFLFLSFSIKLRYNPWMKLFFQNISWFNAVEFIMYLWEPNTH